METHRARNNDGPRCGRLAVPRNAIDVNHESSSAFWSPGILNPGSRAAQFKLRPATEPDIGTRGLTAYSNVLVRTAIKQGGIQR